MTERDLSVDFNDLGSDGRLTASLSYAREGFAPVLGAQVTIEDDDGTNCMAVIEAVSDGLIELRITGGSKGHD